MTIGLDLIQLFLNHTLFPISVTSNEENKQFFFNTSLVKHKCVSHLTRLDRTKLSNTDRVYKKKSDSEKKKKLHSILFHAYSRWKKSVFLSHIYSVCRFKKNSDNTEYNIKARLSLIFNLSTKIKSPISKEEKR